MEGIYSEHRNDGFPVETKDSHRGLGKRFLVVTVNPPNENMMGAGHE